MILESREDSKMLRAILLAAAGLVATEAAAIAADLPVHSRIGAIFAEPAPPPRIRIVREREKDYPESAFYRFRIPPPVPGYYGRPNDFYYRPYYEDRSVLGYYFDRLPYACGFYGYCQD
jgi:hypothetical protein